MKRNIYLEMKPLEEARELFLNAFDWASLTGKETLDTVKALGRVTAEPVFARYSTPGYHAAAMDGIALKAEHSFGADDENPILLKVDEKAWFINTGQALPEGCDSVVMIEQIRQLADGLVELRAPAFPWQYVRRVGEDMIKGELMFPQHHRLRAVDVSALLTAGVFELDVLQKPKVAVIPTGYELVSWQEAKENPPEAGAIIEANSTLLAGLVEEAGGEAVVLPRQTDDPELISAAAKKALESDAHLVLLNAGASAGSKDFSVHVLRELGKVLVHGVTVMPGKPSILGKALGKPLVGTPGYAVSAWVCFDQFIGPALALMQGQAPESRPGLAVLPARPLPSKLGQEEFIRVHLGRVGENIVGTPLKRGAGAITSLTRADGVVRVAVNSEGAAEGTHIKAELLVPESRVDQTVVVVGSHDVTLDILADQMSKNYPGLRMSSSHLGSLAGLMAIKQGRAHLGGTHLLDPETGEYNVSYLKKYLPEVPVNLITLANRKQGFIVKPGNPKGIKDFSDLCKDGVRLINRQPGSGTRVLLDYYLEKQGIGADDIEGYDLDEYTHMAVAVQVLSGGADVGVGIQAAAEALGLSFVPLIDERYDLCIPKAYLADTRIQALFDTLNSADFKKKIDALGGYDTTPMGRVAWMG